MNGDMEKEYQKFMQNIQNTDDKDKMPEFENMLSGLLSELGGGAPGGDIGKEEMDEGKQAQNLESFLNNLQKGMGADMKGG